MPGACSQVLDAGNNLLKAAQQLRIDPLNGSIRSILVDSAKKVLEYTVNVSKSFCSAIYSKNSLELFHNSIFMQVLLTSDDAEVRKIIHTANMVLEKLWILQNVQSWSEFRKHFQVHTASS